MGKRVRCERLPFQTQRLRHGSLCLINEASCPEHITCTKNSSSDHGPLVSRRRTMAHVGSVPIKPRSMHDPSTTIPSTRQSRRFSNGAKNRNDPPERPARAPSTRMSRSMPGGQTRRSNSVQLSPRPPMNDRSFQGGSQRRRPTSHYRRQGTSPATPSPPTSPKPRYSRRANLSRRSPSGRNVHQQPASFHGSSRSLNMSNRSLNAEKSPKGGARGTLERARTSSQRSLLMLPGLTRMGDSGNNLNDFVTGSRIRTLNGSGSFRHKY